MAPANTNEIRALTEDEIARLENALGEPIERSYLVHWVSQAIQALPDEGSYAAVDAAIRRWQKSTGISATLAGSGQTFKAIAQKRRKAAPARRASGPAAVAPSSEPA
jgi:hypothetical protein